MRVLHVVPSIFGPGGVVGGAERYAFELARFMSRKTPTTLLAFGDVAQSYSVEGLQVDVHAPYRRIKQQPYNPFSWRALARFRHFDVLHFHQTHVLTSSMGALLGRLWKKRVFTSDLGGGGWDVSAYLNTDRFFHGHLHISRYSREVFGHADCSRAHDIYGGVDIDKFRPPNASSGRRGFIFVGRLLPHKGVNDLIEAMPKSIRLDVIGEIHDHEYYVWLRKLSEGKDVHFHQGMADDRLIVAYQQAVAIVLPSVYRDYRGRHTRVPELLGQTLLEGMACETAAVCTRVASMPEIVEDSVNGFVVHPNSPSELRRCIDALAHDVEKSHSMGIEARKSILRRFTWEKVVDRCLEIYANPAQTSPA